MRANIHFFLCPAVCNILDLREPEGPVQITYQNLVDSLL
jgi:hypothetical protein